jgi:hypothetical protein
MAPKGSSLVKLDVGAPWLILEPAAGLLEINDRSTSYDDCNSARHFLDRILNSAMAIRSQQLHDLQQYGATQKPCAEDKGAI